MNARMPQQGLARPRLVPVPCIAPLVAEPYFKNSEP